MAHLPQHYSEMRGLNKFINKIKDCNNKETEKDIVKTELGKFSIVFSKSNNVGSYQRMKYVCKLLYIFMMGYKLESFGDREAIKLCAATKFSEKQIGYLAVGVLIDETHESLPLLIETLRADLQSNNFEVQALAVGAIANIGGRILAKEFSEIVINLLMSNQSSIQLKKKASLCLLRIFKKHPDIVTPEFLCLKIEGLLSIYHLGLLTSVMSLLLGMVEVATDVSQYSPFLPRVIEILNQIVFHTEKGNHHSQSYEYMGISNPWLQIKLLRFIQQFKLTDPLLYSNVLRIVSHILNEPRDQSHDSENHRSAKNAILSEVFDIMCGIDSPAEISRAVELLIQGAVASSNPNFIFLSITKLTKLCQKNNSAVYFAAHHYHQVLSLFQSKDPEVKLISLELFLAMRTAENTNHLVQDMLQIISSEDPVLQFPLIENVAILAESVSKTNPAWYIEVFTRLLSVSGDTVSETMRNTLITTINDNPHLHSFAAKLYLQFLSEQPKAREPLVVVGSILLRKFGHEIVNEPGFGYSQQFKALSSQTEVKTAKGKEELNATLELLKNHPEEASSVSHNVSSQVLSQFSTSSSFSEIQQENPENNENFAEICRTKQGILLQTEQIQLGSMINSNSNVVNSSVDFTLFFGNLNVNFPINNLQIKFFKKEEEIKIEEENLQSSIEAQQQIPQKIVVTCLKEFSDAPKFELKFDCEKKNFHFEGNLPINLLSFSSPLVVGTQEFLSLWSLYAIPPQEQQVTWTTKKGIDKKRAEEVVTAFNFNIEENVDPSPNNFVFSTSFHSVHSQVNILCRLEADESHQMYRVTVRSPNPAVSISVANTLKFQIL